MSKKLRNWLIIGAILLIIFLILGKKMGWLGGKKGTEVTTTEVKRATINESVIASGKIQPEVEVKISSEVSGEIIELPIVEGQKVKKGDLLVRINPDIYQASVNRSLASLNSSKSAVATAKAQFKEAKSNYERNKTLNEQGVISASEFEGIQRAYDVGQLNVESAEYQLQSAQATYREALDNLERTTIYAPQSGTVTSLNVEVGERVVGTAQMAGTEMMRIADLENMEVLVDVNENDIVRVSKGDTATIEVDAYLDKEFKGIVTEISNSANLVAGASTDQVTNFEVKVRILKESYKDVTKKGEASPFRPGMTASVEIKTNSKSNVLAVPIEAVTTRSDTSKNASSYSFDSSSEKTDSNKDEEKEEYEVVFLFKDGKAQLQTVKTGIQDDELIEITSGLNEGQKVITGPYSVVSKTLTNGADVEETKKEK